MNEIAQLLLLAEWQTHHYSVKSTPNFVLRTWMVGEEFLHDDIFVLWAETFAISVSARTHAAWLELTREEESLDHSISILTKFITTAEGERR